MNNLAIFALFAFAVSSAGHAAEGTKLPIQGDPTRGRTIADKWCAGCHNIGAGTATDQIPSFANVAKRHRTQPEALRAFLYAPHKPMPPLQLTNQEIEDLAVYIEHQK